MCYACFLRAERRSHWSPARRKAVEIIERAPAALVIGAIFVFLGYCLLNP